MILPEKSNNNKMMTYTHWTISPSCHYDLGFNKGSISTIALKMSSWSMQASSRCYLNLSPSVKASNVREWDSWKLYDVGSIDGDVDRSSNFRNLRTIQLRVDFVFLSYVLW